MRNVKFSAKRKHGRLSIFYYDLLLSMIRDRRAPIRPQVKSAKINLSEFPPCCQPPDSLTIPKGCCRFRVSNVPNLVLGRRSINSEITWLPSVWIGVEQPQSNPNPMWRWKRMCVCCFCPRKEEQFWSAAGSRRSSWGETHNWFFRRHRRGIEVCVKLYWKRTKKYTKQQDWGGGTYCWREIRNNRAKRCVGSVSRDKKVCD